MKKSNKYWTAFLLICFCLSVAYGQGVPKLIQYQGNLADDKGDFIHGQRTLTFGIFAASTGGTAIWTETHNGVQINKGLFSVMLGSITPLSEEVFKEAERYLEVSVDGKPLAPRQKIAAVAYALVAQSVANGAITAAQIKDGAIGSSEILSEVIESKHIKDGSIKTADIAAGAINSNLIKDESIQGTDITNKTIAGNKLVPRYISPWTSDNNTTTHKTPFPHQLRLNLSSDPVMFDLYFSPDNPPSKIYPVTWRWDGNAGNPVMIEITSNSIVLHIHNGSWLHGIWSADNSRWTPYAKGYWQVIIW